MRSPRWAGLGLCGLLLAACGGGDDDADAPEASDTVTTAADGTTLPGAVLELGEPATVAYTAAKKDSQLRLAVTVVKAGKVSDLSQFTLSDAAKASGVYYVKVNVTNLGTADLGGELLTLYGKASETLVVRPVVFGSSFAKCDYTPLPKKFTEGKKTTLCMVMLAPKHGEISAVEWRGADDAEPMSWTAP